MDLRKRFRLLACIAVMLGIVVSGSYSLVAWGAPQELFHWQLTDDADLLVKPNPFQLLRYYLPTPLRPDPLACEPGEIP